MDEKTDAKPIAENRQHHYVDVVLVCEAKKNEDSGDSDEEKVINSSFFGFETELLQYRLNELAGKENQRRQQQQLSKSVSYASDCSDERDIPGLQESDSENMLLATRSFVLFSFSSDSSSGVLDSTLSEFSSFELYELEGSSYCCDDLSVRFLGEDYDETKQVQHDHKPSEAFERTASSMLGCLRYTDTHSLEKTTITSG